MKNISKRVVLLTGVFSAFLTVGVISHFQVHAQTTADQAVTQDQKISQSSEEQQAFVVAQEKAKAEMDRFNKMTPVEQKAYMENLQKKADEQFDRISKNLSPEQKKVLEAERVKAKAEMERFNQMTPEQKKVYMEEAQNRMGAQMKNITPEQQKQIEQLQKNINK